MQAKLIVNAKAYEMCKWALMLLCSLYSVRIDYQSFIKSGVIYNNSARWTYVHYLVPLFSPFSKSSNMKIFQCSKKLSKLFVICQRDGAVNSHSYITSYVPESIIV